jgi:hypothetical protein
MSKMDHNEACIDSTKVKYHIDKLRSFLGENNVEKCLKKYTRSLEVSGPIFRDYYLKNLHPWWGTFTTVSEIIDSGKVLSRCLTPEIKMLAGDAMKVTTLQHLMPEPVREKYKKDLLDDENAKNYLFEFTIAWHFYLRGASIEWYDKKQGKQPEYLIKTPDFEFNVECKRINIDISRKIKRKDFYRFSDILLPEIEKNNYSGKIEIILNGRLENNDNYFNSLKTHIMQFVEGVNSNRIQGEHQMSMGKISLDLTQSKGEPIDIRGYYTNLLQRKPENAHVALLAKPFNNQLINPIEIMMSSEKQEGIVDAVREVISAAGREQLYCDKPGLIACFLEGIEGHELDELNSNCALQAMTCCQLSKPEYSHVMGVAYTVEQNISILRNVEIYNYPHLLFPNPKCKFENASKLLQEYAHSIMKEK